MYNFDGKKEKKMCVRVTKLYVEAEIHNREIVTLLDSKKIRFLHEFFSSFPF